jgi:hypothetical protein
MLLTSYLGRMLQKYSEERARRIRGGGVAHEEGAGCYAAGNVLEVGGFEWMMGRGLVSRVEADDDSCK